jgi:rhamnosyltransferase
LIKPKVLIVLCSYNGEKYIQEQINSILNQTDIQVSLMIYDDRSKDETISIINNINDSRISVFINEFNSSSPAHNFLNAINRTYLNDILNHDYFALADQDDVWLENKISSAINLIKKSQASLYCSNLTKWVENKNTTSIIKKNYSQKKYDYLFEGGSAGCTYVLDKTFFLSLKHMINNVSNWNNKYLSHDWLIYFFARHKNYKVIIDQTSYIKYRIHNNNVHGLLNANNLSAVFKRLSLIKNGWFTSQINFYLQFLDNNSIEKKIYLKYKKSYFNRIFILIKYNFSLFRSPLKFLKFFLINLFVKV